MGRRVIIHLDLDAFYAQVEAGRLGIDLAKCPLAVVQWTGLLAISYSARPAGVKRMDTPADARRKCPGIRLVHVEYRSAEGPLVMAGLDGEQTGPGGQVLDPRRTLMPIKDRFKVSLARYRSASRDVLKALAFLSEHVERASIDECYVDVSTQAAGALRPGVFDEEVWGMAAATLVAADGDGNTGCIIGRERMESAAARACSGGAAGVGGGSSDDDWLLCGGALISAAMRRAVLRATGFTMSAGVAHCKMLAKLASARNKPARQTAVFAANVGAMMAALPLREINGLRGKEGERVVAILGDEKIMASAVLERWTEQELGLLLGSGAASRLRRLCAGDDASEVLPNLKPKSLNVFKSFNTALATDGQLEEWLRLLSLELAERIEEDVSLNSRRPSTVTVGHRGGWGRPMTSRSQRISGGTLTAPRLVGIARGLVRRLDVPLPCCRLALSVGAFVDVDASSKSITSFLRSPVQGASPDTTTSGGGGGGKVVGSGGDGNGDTMKHHLAASPSSSPHIMTPHNPHEAGAGAIQTAIGLGSVDSKHKQGAAGSRLGQLLAKRKDPPESMGSTGGMRARGEGAGGRAAGGWSRGGESSNEAAGGMAAGQQAGQHNVGRQRGHFQAGSGGVVCPVGSTTSACASGSSSGTVIVGAVSAAAAPTPTAAATAATHSVVDAHDADYQFALRLQREWRAKEAGAANISAGKMARGKKKQKKKKEEEGRQSRSEGGRGIRAFFGGS